jgi:hypothetical protein
MTLPLGTVKFVHVNIILNYAMNNYKYNVYMFLSYQSLYFQNILPLLKPFMHLLAFSCFFWMSTQLNETRKPIWDAVTRSEADIRPSPLRKANISWKYSLIIELLSYSVVICKVSRTSTQALFHSSLFVQLSVSVKISIIGVRGYSLIKT